MSNLKFLHKEEPSNLKEQDNQNVSFWVILCLILGLALLFATPYLWNKLKIYIQRRNFNHPNYPILMLLGVAGVGKTQIAKQMAKYQNEKLFQSPDAKEFFHVHVRNITIADTPALDLASSIDVREKTISSFQKYFTLCLNKISVLAIVVNFERTDLMKNKINEVYRHFRNFNCEIIIIVTDWQLSENPGDQQDLETKFKIYNPRTIVFWKKNENPQNLWIKLQALNFQPQQINLNETMFEFQDQNQLQQNMDQLGILIRNNLVKKKGINYTDDGYDKLIDC